VFAFLNNYHPAKQILFVMAKNTIKRTSRQIIIVMFAAIALVGVLAWLAAAPLRENNGFNRKFAFSVSQPLQIADKDPWAWSISGINKNVFYIQGRQPNQLIRFLRDRLLPDTLIYL